MAPFAFEVDESSVTHSSITKDPANQLSRLPAHGQSNPQLQNDEHLLKVYSTVITRGESIWPIPEEPYKDYSPGVEMSGIVIASPSSSKYPTGTEVHVRTTAPRCGSARQYTIGLGTELARKPQNTTHDEAAAVPVSALTAWQALFVQQAGYDAPIPNASLSRNSLGTTKRILVVGASGSVGLWATQLAQAACFYVVGSCHGRNVALVRAFGAHEAIDYTKSSISQWIDDSKALQKFDLVLDCVGPGGSADAWYATHPEGDLVLSIVPPAYMVWKWTLDRPEGIGSNVHGRFFIMECDGGQLEKVTELIEAGSMKPVIDSVFRLEEYNKAFERADRGKATSKVVMKVCE